MKLNIALLRLVLVNLVPADSTGVRNKDPRVSAAVFFRHPTGHGSELTTVERAPFVTLLMLLF